MHRTGLRSVALSAALALGVVLAPATALAFHAGATFDKPAGAGGGGGLYYAGVMLEHGWDCTTCHIDPAGKIDLGVTIDPPLTGAMYVPGQAYSFEVKLLNEHAGLDRGAYNFNGLVAEVVDAQGFQSGSFDGFASTDFDQPYPATIAYGRPPSPGVTSWKFRWTAPETGKGPVSFHIAVVDGDGAASATDEAATTDPYRDDFAMRLYRLSEAAPTASRSPSRPQTFGFAVGCAALVLVRSRKRRPRPTA
jgi:hypothetical protein